MSPKIIKKSRRVKMRFTFFSTAFLIASSLAIKLPDNEELILAQELPGYDHIETVSAVHGIADASQNAIDALASASKSAVNNEKASAKAASEQVKAATTIAKNAIKKAADNGAAAVKSQANSA